LHRIATGLTDVIPNRHLAETKGKIFFHRAPNLAAMDSSGRRQAGSLAIAVIRLTGSNINPGQSLTIILL
jgi:hypothetical protein